MRFGPNVSYGDFCQLSPEATIDVVSKALALNRSIASFFWSAGGGRS